MKERVGVWILGDMEVVQLLPHMNKLYIEERKTSKQKVEATAYKLSFGTISPVV